MLTARLGSIIIRAGFNLKGKNFTYRCLDEHCDSPEMELVLGRGLRIPHFRHKRRGQCSCSDGETEWHLEWKSHFERIECDMGVDDVTGERNRADAVVGENFVIEFQHSPISLDEQHNRERFYGEKGGMIWIVDANKKRLKKRITAAIENRIFTPLKEPPFDGLYFTINFPAEVFPKEWLTRPVGVVFDYGQDCNLTYLLPMLDPSRAVCKFYKRDDLIDALIKMSQQFMRSADQMLSDYRLQEQRKHEAEERSKRKAEEEKRKADLAIRDKIKKAYIQAQKLQQTLPVNKLSIQPVEGTSLFVDAKGYIYHRDGNRLVPVPGPYRPPRFPKRRGPRL